MGAQGEALLRSIPDPAEARSRRAMLHMLEDLQRERRALQQAHRNWLDTVDAVRDPMVVHDAAGRVIRCNLAYAERAGTPIQEVIGRPWRECFPREGRTATGGEAEVRLASGEVFIDRAFPVGTEHDANVLHLFEDVTDRYRAGEQARAVQDIALSAMLLAGDVEAVARLITEAATRVTGVARANVWLFNEAEDELRCIDLYEAGSGQHSAGMVLQERQFANEFRALKGAPYVDASEPLTDPRTCGYAEGYLKPLGITSMLDPVLEVSGRHVGLLCLEHVGRPHRWQADEIAFAARLTDKIAVVLSHRKARDAEKALRESERRFRAIFEQAPVGIAMQSVEGRYLVVNERLCEITGYSREELLAKRFQDITHPDDQGDSARALGVLRSAQSPRQALEKRYVRKDGRPVWASVTVTALRDEAGTVESMVSIVEDIDARRAAEAEIRALARFPHENPNAVMRIAQDGRVMYANPTSAPLQDICGASVGGYARGSCFEALRRCMAAGVVQELEVEHGARSFAITMAPVPSEGYANVYGTDITARRAFEIALRQSEEKFRGLFDRTVDGISVMGVADRRVRFANAAMHALLGYEPGSLDGRPVAEFIQAGTESRVLELFERGASGAIQSAMDVPVRCRDGSTVHVDVTGGVVRIGGEACLLGNFRDAGPRRAGEQRLLRLNRALQTLSAGNIALVHAADEAGLLAEMARVLHEVGNYPLALIGYAVHDAGQSIQIKACKGMSSAEGEKLALSWGEPAGGHVTGRAIRLGTTQMERNIAANPAYEPWRERLSARGVNATLSLPLRLVPGAAPFGSLTVGAAGAQGFDDEEIKLLEELAGDLGYGIRNLRTAIQRRESADKLRRSLEGTIQAIAATVETRDAYTAGHQRRVAELAAAIGTEMGLPPETIEGIHFGALIHDLGKVQVPAEILAKPGRLSRQEFELIKTHPQAGYEILKDIELPWPVAQMVHQHHERLDGSGYPQGLKGDEIVLEARVVAVADVVEAMSSHRPYRPGKGIEPALGEIEAGRGRAYDAAAVDACLRLFREKGYRLPE